MIVRDMATGAVRNIGNVNQYEFDDDGKLLAYTVDATDRLGNGVYVLDPATGTTRALATAARRLRSAHLEQRRRQPRRAARRQASRHEPEGQRAARVDRRRERRGSPSRTIRRKDASFPKGMVLSEFTAPRWSKDGSRIFVGIKEQEPEIAGADSNKANVDIWHWKDQTPQSVQIVQLQQLRRATYPAVILVNSGKLVQLGDDDMRTSRPPRTRTSAVGRNDAAYRGEVAWGGSRSDLYKVDVATGARTLIDKGALADVRHVARLEAGSSISRTSRCTRSTSRTALGRRSTRRTFPRSPTSTTTTITRTRSPSGDSAAGRKTASRCCSTTSTTSGRRRSTAARRRTSRRASVGRRASSSASCASVRRRWWTRRPRRWTWRRRRGGGQTTASISRSP